MNKTASLFVRSATAVLVLAVCVVTAPAALAQLPKPKPKPKPKPAASSAAQQLPGVILVSTDAACSVAIDGQKPTAFRADESRRLHVTLGKHLVRAVSDRGAVTWETAVEVKDKAQELVTVRLKERVAQALWVEAQRPAASDLAPGNAAGSGARPVLLVVDPALADAAQRLAASLRAAGIEIGPPASSAAARGAARPRAGDRAVMREQSHRMGAATEVAGVKMDSCSVSVDLSVWTATAAEPKTWSVEETGAGVGELAACAAGRRKAVASAVSLLAKFAQGER